LKQRYGGAQPNISQNVIRNFPVRLPSISAQQKIAGVLGVVQRALEQQERLIGLTTELKKALLLQLFTQGVHGEPQKETEIGRVPMSWHVAPLGDYLLEAQYGISAKGGEAGKHALLRMTNQKHGRISGDNLQFVTLTPHQLESFRVAKLDLLFNRTNSFELVGRTAIFMLDGDFVFASYLIRLRTDVTRLRPHFLNLYFNWHETQARLKSIASRAVSQSNISTARLRGFVVPIPKLEEQDKNINDIDCVDQRLALHRKKRAALNDLFRTLLHQLMTAKIRVHDLDLPELESAIAA
jgi:type I restriction enzyme, S subunit